MWTQITEKLICPDLVFNMYFLGRCSFELVTFLVGGALVIPIACMIFQSPSIDVIKMFIPTVFLPETARL